MPDISLFGTLNDKTPALVEGASPVAVRRDAETPPSGLDGGPAALQVNEIGRLKVSTMPGMYPTVVGSLTAIQTVANTSVVGATVPVDVSRISNLTIYPKGIYAGYNCIFEASLDSTNGIDGMWYGIQGARTNANTVETVTGALTGTAVSGPLYAWELSVNGYIWFRVRATARSSGTQTWTIAPAAYATEPAPAIQAHAVTMSSTSISAVTPGVAATNLGKTRGATAGGSDVGIEQLGVRNDNAVTDLSTTNNYYTPVAVDQKGAIFTREKPSVGATVTSVASSVASVTVLALNVARRGATVFNESTATLYLKFGATASLISYSVQVAPGGYFELPFNYTGVIDGIWPAADGAARVTELS